MTNDSKLNLLRWKQRWKMIFDIIRKEEEKKEILLKKEELELFISAEWKFYTSFNVKMLLKQEWKPGIYGGVKQWREKKRRVKKGSIGFSIIYPVFDKKTKEKKEDDPINFYFWTIFHFSQTEEMRKAD